MSVPAGEGTSARVRDPARARGLAQRSADASWELTSEGAEYVAELG